MLSWVDPSASSGRTHRTANNALCGWFLAAFSTAQAPAYTERRTHGGLSKPEIIGCLKHYVAREIFNPLPTLVAENRSAHPLARP